MTFSYMTGFLDALNSLGAFCSFQWLWVLSVWIQYSSWSTSKNEVVTIHMHMQKTNLHIQIECLLVCTKNVSLFLPHLWWIVPDTFVDEVGGMVVSLLKMSYHTGVVAPLDTLRMCCWGSSHHSFLYSKMDITAHTVTWPLSHPTMWIRKS